MVGQKNKGVNERLEGQKHTKYNIINNNSENFRGGNIATRLLPKFRVCQDWINLGAYGPK